MEDEPVFVFLATYDSEADAKLDYEAVKVKVHKHEKPTQHGAWTGVAVGAVVGILFPPALLLDVAVGGLAGGTIGHFWNGISRKDVMELCELLDDSSAALLVVGRSTLDRALEKAVTHAVRVVEKEIKADQKELDKELKKAEKEAK